MKRDAVTGRLAGARRVIGVVSDTHGLVRPALLEALRGVDSIVHAGDVGPEEVLTELETLAPVFAVYGNVDRFPLLDRLPEHRILEVGSTRIFVTHIGGTPEQMHERFPELASCQIAIFGHSHRPLQQNSGGILFFNPGSAGPRRFKLPVTAGQLLIDADQFSARILEID